MREQCIDRRQWTVSSTESSKKHHHINEKPFFLPLRSAKTRWKRVKWMYIWDRAVQRKTSQADQDGWRKDAYVKILKSIQCRRSIVFCAFRGSVRFSFLFSYETASLLPCTLLSFIPICSFSSFINFSADSTVVCFFFFLASFFFWWTHFSCM